MLQVTQEQAIERWDALPDNLREAIVSEDNADILWNLCRSNHLNEEKTRRVSLVAGDVLMGFMHPDADDIAREIRERTDIHPEIALAIAKELEKKIFSRLRSDLDRIYATPKSPIGGGFSRLPEETEITAKLPEKETSEQTAGMKSLEAPAGIPFSKDISATEKLETAPPAPKKAPEPPIEEDKPFILHEEKAVFEPTASREKPSVIFNPARRSAPSQTPKKVTVRIETPDGESEASRVVHYSNLRTPLDRENAR